MAPPLKQDGPPCAKCGRPMIRFSKAGSGRLRWLCRGGENKRGYCYSTTNPGAPMRTRTGDLAERPAAFDQKLRGARFIITAAQNATPVHKGFLASLLHACRHLDAQLLVVPIRYKNPTSQWPDSQANAEHWADELVPYLCNVRKRLNKNLVLLGDIKTQPTAVSPLAGFEAITHGESGILAHTKLQFRAIPTPQHRYPKVLTTTGACTRPNYTDSKAGALGDFHHTLGATLVEIDGHRFHLRQINATKDGSFYDLDAHYTPDGVTTGHAIAALVLGDSHTDFIDPIVERTTFGRGGIVDTLNPQYLVWHDLCDHSSVNPHEQHVFATLAKHRAGRRNAAEEVQRALEFVRKRTGDGRTSVIVPSNHNDFLRRWVIGHDWRDDPENAQFYLETALDMVRATRLGKGGPEYPDPFVMLARRQLSGEHYRVLGVDESFVIAGVELGMHGHLGPNGARGSLKNFRRIGVRSIIGHAHAPGIDEGCFGAGTSSRLRLSYNAGPSSWLNSHVALYPNSKRSIITIIDGRWRL